MDLQILYEDNHLIGVYKPHGVLVQGDASRDKSLMDYVKEYLKKKHNKPGNVFLGLLHRLDRPVAGIVLFAKTSKGASRLSEQIRERKIKKSYTALVSPVPEKREAELVHFMVKNSAKNKSWAHDEPTKNSKKAILKYVVEKVDELEETARLKIDLYTGRHHQIRAQLSAIKSPIVGDSKYGSKKGLANLRRICLCASELTFKQATSDKVVTLKCETEF